MILQLHLKGNQPALSVFEALSLMLMFGILIVNITIDKKKPLYITLTGYRVAEMSTI
ncbi:putative holin-like toxin [Xylocopilactobacillus apicola]|uniref:Uncharacterized protein n=1 Tax=Xylocopilactobacillus apicola TaxID=2932184 RepID=A0AAU9DCR9_9LACO|nr:putative holin-like toxin [Xylocopilactobacillus apicola]BDR57585.1 hypothetical protein XA3_00260 [Xylocopilactobacillus apicola]